MSNSINAKKIAQNSFFLYFRMLFQIIISLYTAKIVLHALGAENYGLYDVVAGIIVVLMFLNNSMTTSTLRYITNAVGIGSSTYVSKIFSISIVLHFLLGLLLIVLGSFVGLLYIRNILVFPLHMYEDVFWVFICALVSGFLMIIGVPFNALIIAQENMKAFAYISILDVVLKWLVAYSLCFFQHPHILILYAILLLLETLVVRCVYILYCYRNYREIRFVIVRNKDLYREVLAFMGWSTLGNLSLVANTQGINLLLNFFFGPIVNAARGFSFQVQSAITSFISSFQTAVNPQITKLYANGNIESMNNLILKSSRLSYLMMLFIFVPLIFQMDFYMKLWLSEVPDHTVLFAKILLCVSMVDAIANPMMIGAAATGNVKKYYIHIGCCLLLTLPVGYVVLKVFQIPEYIFVVYLIFTIIAQILRMNLCRELFDFSIRKFLDKVFVKVFICSIVAIILPFVFFKYVHPTLFHNLMFSTLSIIWVGVVVVILGLDKIERSWVNEKVCNFFKKV